MYEMNYQWALEYFYTYILNRICDNFNSFLKHTLEAKFSKVHQLRDVFTINTPTLHVHAQSHSDSINTYFLVATDVLMQSLLLLKLLIVTFLGGGRLDRFHSFPETCSNKCLFFSSASCNLVLKNIMQKMFLKKIQNPDFKSKVHFGRVLKVFSARSESERICLFWATKQL